MDKQELISELDRAFSDTINWLNDQHEDQLNQEIIPDKWTAAGHIYHLVKSTKEKYKKAIAPGLTAASDFVAEKGRIFEKAALIKRFQDELTDLKKILNKWDEKSLGEYILPHPAIGKITIREMMYFTIFHTDHHLRTLKEKYT